MRLSLLVACSTNGIIGRDGGLPWKLSADLKRFKALTMGHPLLMGRKTFDSIGRPLPGRTSIVISRQIRDQNDAFPLVRFVTSLPEAVQLARQLQTDETEAFVVGGGEIYRLALPLVVRLYLTLVEGEVLGDTYFPQVDFPLWQLVEQQHYPADEKNDFPHQFCVYDRIRECGTSKVSGL